MAVLDFNKREKTVENRNRLRNAEPPLEEVLQRFSQAVRFSSKRAAAVSQQAKDAASIAAKEARETDKKPPPKKRSRSPKSKTVAVPAQELDGLDATDTVAGAQAEEIDNVIIECSDEDIRDGLFPGAGGIRLSSGKPKAHYYYKLAEICFADHPEYHQEVFAVKPEYKAVQITQQRKLWTEKSRIKSKSMCAATEFRAGDSYTVRLVTKTCENVTEMAVDGRDWRWNHEHRPSYPWDCICDQVGSNITPVGLGNSDADFDTSLLIPPGSSHDNDETSSGREDTGDLSDGLSEPEVVVLDDASESDDDILAGPTLVTAGKRKRGEDKRLRGTVPGKPAGKKTKPQPAISVPATPAAPTSKKATNVKDRFSATTRPAPAETKRDRRRRWIYDVAGSAQARKPSRAGPGPGQAEPSPTHGFGGPRARA
ncbi:hypothetical protein DFH09DRAFT_1288159 [Mycena vulgaris]|nr:hypothetical protein DFH09DRAFT_1288159 [Mycena vulgaris]